MSEGNFANTSNHMVQEVKNIIQGYKMGSLRALAQEPVQNALDAVRKGRKMVEVEYRLLRRLTSSSETCYLLTVTDRGTTGLRGRMVSTKELEARNYKLKPEENWAAFEAQGYTKENEDALGSRGQGKSAFLYHSHVPGEPRRMVMLYDTLLEDDLYRLGMRYARPVDQILSPPLTGKDATAAIQAETYPLEENLAIPLKLQPLSEVGARIIVPFLNEDDARNIQPGSELGAWLQRCWWRAIQLGKLQIRVVDDESGDEETIQPPSWWRDLPRDSGKPSKNGKWHDLRDGGRACVWGDLGFGDGHRIRRLVMLHSDEIEEDEIVKDEPEYAGIQILRGSQWIETRGTRQDFGDDIPPDMRPGFRGFVEFDKHTDGKLRAAETSQHDGFIDQRRKEAEIVRELRSQLASNVREFSVGMGWDTSTSITTQQVSQREKATLTRFLETFLNPNGRKQESSQSGIENERDDLLWDCRLDLDYPDPKIARVDWGQSISRVYVEACVEPSEELLGSADVVLEWVDIQGHAQEIIRRENAISKQWGNDRVQVQFEFGDWQILRGKVNQERQIEVPEPGECRLRVALEYRGGRVKGASRAVYVQTEPPPPPENNPVTLSISAVNMNTDKTRIDHGEILWAEFIARNRTPQTSTYYLTATLKADEISEVFAREKEVELEGTPAGDTPQRKTILSVKCQLFDPYQPIPISAKGAQTSSMPRSSGRYTISADLYDENGELAAHDSKPIYFQRDPGKAKNNLPFDIEQKDQKAMWLMNDSLDLITYPNDYPLYSEMKEIQRQRRALQGRLAFIAEISANGLLEWALRPKETGSASNYDQLYDDSVSANDKLWDDFNRGLEKLSKLDNSPTDYARTWRETVAIMLHIFARDDN